MIPEFEQAKTVHALERAYTSREYKEFNLAYTMIAAFLSQTAMNLTKSTVVIRWS
jgi:hypothetical protein